MLTFKLHLFIKNFFFLFFILILFFFSIIPLLLILILLNFFLFLNSFWLNHKYSQFKTYFFIKFLTPETLTSQVINIFILSYCLTFNFICDWLVENPNNNFFFENLTIKSFFLNFFFFLFFFFSFEIPTISFIWFFNELKKNINLNFFNSTMELLKMFNNTINFSFDTEIFFFNNLKLNKKKNTFFFEVHMCAYYNYDKKIKILNHFIIFKNYKINCSLLLNSYLKKKTEEKFLFLQLKNTKFIYFSLIKFKQPNTFNNSNVFYQKNLLNEKDFLFMKNSFFFFIQNNSLMLLNELNNNQIYSYVGFPKNFL